MRNMNHRAWLLALAAVGCTAGDPETQVLTGRVQTAGALGVRAVADDTVITAAAVRSDGTFTMELPVGQHYRLEVLTTSGVRHVVASKNGTLTALTFTVCDPMAPFDIGGIGPNGMMGGGGGSGGGGGGGGGTPCDPSTDPMCPPPPPPCDPMLEMCEPPPPPPMCGPSDPMCPPPPPPPPSCPFGDASCCDPMTDPMCPPNPPPPPCDPATDPMCDVCTYGSMDPGCQPPPCMDPADPYCWCDANGVCPPPTCQPGEMCPPPPPPPCMDPMDPTTCNDPCASDPASCGCSTMDASCWPPPQPPDCMLGGMCDPGGGWMTPDHPPFDFGCQDATAP